VQMHLRYAQTMLQSAQPAHDDRSPDRALQGLERSSTQGTRGSSHILAPAMGFEPSFIDRGTVGSSQPEPASTEVTEILPDVKVHYETRADLVIDAIRKCRQADKRAFDIALHAYKHSFRVSFDQRLCLPTPKKCRATVAPAGNSSEGAEGVPRSSHSGR
jgi:hypothetical protein